MINRADFCILIVVRLALLTLHDKDNDSDQYSDDNDSSDNDPDPPSDPTVVGGVGGRLNTGAPYRR